jgi:hypothetical protein
MLQQVGGPAGTGPRPVAGTVRFRSQSGLVRSAPVLDDGAFRLALPAGRYEVTGTPAGGSGQVCRAEKDVVGPADGLGGIEVNCHVR